MVGDDDPSVEYPTCVALVGVAGLLAVRTLYGDSSARRAVGAPADDD
ncbi:hypothetical protein [Halorussus pelagicus]|nr:hypothetical protein [Halorussus pelagicus]